MCQIQASCLIPLGQLDGKDTVGPIVLRGSQVRERDVRWPVFTVKMQSHVRVLIAQMKFNKCSLQMK